MSALGEWTGAPGVRLPQNVEAEAALLGAMMIDNRIADDVAESLDASHFFEPLHGRIFAAIKACRQKGELATPVTLRPLFEADRSMLELNGPGYLAQLTGSGAGLIGARDFARQIVDLATLRAVVQVGLRLAEEGMDTSEEVNPRGLLERAETMLSSVTWQGGADPKAISLANAWDDAFKEIDAIGSGLKERGIIIPHWFEWNDIIGGGMMAGQFILLGGRPGMGKTAASLTVARRATEAGHGVLFISREMPVVAQLMMRLVADMLFEAGSQATFDDVLRGKLNDHDRQLAAGIRAKIDQWPLVFEEPTSLNASGIAPLIRRHKRQMAKRGKALKLVVVDYLGLLDPPEKRANREQEMSDVSKAMKAAARANGVALLCLAQLNRAVEQRDDKRPVLSDLRDSGSLEQDADTVVFVDRAEYYLKQTEPDVHDARKREAWEIEMGAERDRLEVYSAKVRQGSTQRRRVHFFGSRQAIRNGDFNRDGGGPA